MRLLGRIQLQAAIKDEAARFEQNQEVQEFMSAMRQHLSEAMTLRGQKISDAQYYREAAQLKDAMLSLCVNETRSEREPPHPAVKRWAEFFSETADRLYHWVADREVPCENNRAERELRPTVTARKVSHGSQAEEGAKTREVLMSLLQSLKKRASNPRQRFKAMLDKISEHRDLKVTSLLFEADSS